MIRLRVKNFGPVREGRKDSNGWIEFKRVTIFVGNQGSGKSTVAKLFATFSWIEKALVRGDYEKKWFERKNRFTNQFLAYHRLENFFAHGKADEAEIEYEGEAYAIRFVSGQLSIDELKQERYSLPQVMYVPAERNFISYVRQPKELKLSSESLLEFLTEFDKAKANLKDRLRLPINDADIEYDKLNDILNIRDDRFKVRLTDASSGFQSAVPLYLVSYHLANMVGQQSESDQESMSVDELERFKNEVAQIFGNQSLSEQQRRAAISVLSSRFNKTAFINIVEEPEQNLYPESQWSMLQSLLLFNNQGRDNRLVLTTHSPYVVNYLTIAVQGDNLRQNILRKERHKELMGKLDAIVPLTALVGARDLAIYQSDEKDGSISLLDSIDGIPTDRNYLNDALRKGNELFDQLLELEEELPE
jgi:predicted ATPase